jgi:hypothetical protein
LRVRLTCSEVAGLRRVEQTAHFASGHGLTYRIRKGAGGGIRAEPADGMITVHVPAGAVEAWAGSEEVGLTARDGALRIAIEKDFRCLTRPREEDEPDAYPHPTEQWSC